MPMKTFKILQLNMQYGQGWDDANPDHARQQARHDIGSVTGDLLEALQAALSMSRI